MKLVILGATGGVGLEIVRQALARNHRVKAFVRSAERLRPFTNQVEVELGDLLNADALATAIRGCDAILSGFGPRLPIANADANLLRDFAAALTRAMQQAGIRRAVIVSTAFLFKDAILPPAHLFGRLLFPGVVKDATAMEQIILKSNLAGPSFVRLNSLISHAPEITAFAAATCPPSASRSLAPMWLTSASTPSRAPHRSQRSSGSATDMNASPCRRRLVCVHQAELPQKDPKQNCGEDFNPYIPYCRRSAQILIETSSSAG